MKLLSLYFDHVVLFKNGIFNIDLFAADKVPASDESVCELARPVYTNNVIALAGINATGKSTALALIELACRIINGQSLNSHGLPTTLPGIFEGSATLRISAWSNGAIYLVESILREEADEEGRAVNPRRLVFAKEVIRRIMPSGLKKASLQRWDDLVDKSEVIAERPSSIWEPFDTPGLLDISIAYNAIERHSGTRQSVPFARDERFSLWEGSDGLDDMLRVFDSNIEHLEVRDSGRAFELKFRNRKPLVLSEEGLSEVLSAGTVRGVSLVQTALKILRGGGYLMVDEIENHLNRQLVNVVLDLFTARDTNPLGATVLFTTHYPQLLDHVHRKDNVYFLVRGESGLTETVKYSTRVKRIENKKSEVFASNYVKGTAPRYTDVTALKVYIRKAVVDGAR